jgi:hypothetical protein
MSVAASKNRLAGLTRELMVRWRETTDHWRDAKAQEFEEKYLEDLTTSVDRAATVIEQLDKLLAKVRKDCE